jgi:sigma-B regulation protein RsbU (phosphoserine phosphatase)
MVCVVDRETSRVKAVSAGGLPVLLRRADGQVQDLGEHAGPPVGIIEDAGYRCVEAELAPGERVLLFNDVMVEGLAPDGSQ